MEGNLLETATTSLKSRVEQELYFLNLVKIASKANIAAHRQYSTTDNTLRSDNLSASMESLLSIDSLLLSSIETSSLSGISTASAFGLASNNNSPDLSRTLAYQTPDMIRKTVLGSASGGIQRAIQTVRNSGGKGIVHT